MKLATLARGALAAAVSPGVEQVGLSARFGYDPSHPRVRELSAIPQAVVVGLEAGLTEPSIERLHQRLALVTEEHRGFAYEGATMAAVLRDALRPVVPCRTMPSYAASVMSGPGLNYQLLNYIGVGFALARLPARLRRARLPTDLVAPHHPTLSWLAVDGFGFDLAYFDPDRYLRRHVSAPFLSWGANNDWFVARVIDQGFGRALWFVDAGQVDDVARSIENFAPNRRSDLWSGVGLAATFAGQASNVDQLTECAGPYGPDLRLGAILAATARVQAQFVPDHVTSTLWALAGIDPESAAAMVDQWATDDAAQWPAPGYAMWRANLRSVLR